ncbi:MAG TPA: hypothetical protein VKT77_03660 [Chthonomonadaceae bacterium]|nr:hypothetical protein [Chthonomonadaceae bacterium]
MLLYVLEPARTSGSLVPVSEPGLPWHTGSKVLLASMRKSFPTLSGFSPGPLQVMWLNERLRPDQCQRDFVWDHKGRPMIR